MLVTTLYPYGRGEAFVKAELEHLSPFFDEVDIVPCVYNPQLQHAPINQTVNLGYAKLRWGARRGVQVVKAFVAALVTFRWRDDALKVLRSEHRLTNLKELARALYRASMFQRFLAEQVAASGAIDIVYFYWMVPEILGAVQFRNQSGLPIKVICRAHSGDLYENLRAGGYAGLRQSIVNGVDQIYCISDFGRKYVVRHYPLHAQKAHIARLGTNDPGFLNPHPRHCALSIVSCSFCVHEKRLNLIADAIAFLLANDPTLTIEWTHVGDGPLYQQLRSHVQKVLGQRAQVVFKGYLTQRQVMELYREAGFDVFVNVSNSEGIPVSLMEASSTGIPLVATDVGGSSEIVNASNGVLLPPNPDVAEIANALLRFSDRALAVQQRAAARAFWHQQFNAPTNYQQFGQQLVSILPCPVRAA